MIASIVALVFALLCVSWAVGAYKRLLTTRAACLGASGRIDTHLGRLAALAREQASSATDDDARRLRVELSSTEHRIAFARQAYNDSVLHYNRALQQFPGSIVARLFRFRPLEPVPAAAAPVERRQERADG